MGSITKVIQTPTERIRQGDIYRNLEYIESYIENNGVFELNKIIFPYGIVLTQDCDLTQNHEKFFKEENHNNFLLSILIAPIYNYEHLKSGEHLGDLGYSMERVNSKKSKSLQNNEIPRYHYLEFSDDVSMPNCVIDFKHYFSINVECLRTKRENLECSVSELYRERISQRFSNYLSRIGLP